MVWLKSPKSQLSKTFFQIENPLNIKEVMNQNVCVCSFPLFDIFDIHSLTPIMCTLSIFDIFDIALIFCTVFNAFNAMCRLIQVSLGVYRVFQTFLFHLQSSQGITNVNRSHNKPLDIIETI